MLLNSDLGCNCTSYHNTERSLLKKLWSKWVLNGRMVSLAVLVTVQRVRCYNLTCWFIFLYTGLLSFICPCIQFGRNAEAVGESCLMYALSQFVPILDLYCRTIVRGKIRQQKAIDGSCLNDLICHIFCEPCALAQEAQVCRFNMYFINASTQ